MSKNDIFIEKIKAAEGDIEQIQQIAEEGLQEAVWDIAVANAMIEAGAKVGGFMLMQQATTLLAMSNMVGFATTKEEEDAKTPNE